MSAISGNIRLASGTFMPSVGIGTWLVQGDAARKEVEWALDAGYRLIDTAAVYGNEDEVGKAIHNQISSSKIKREDIFVTTKFWPTNVKRREDVPLRLKESLARLKLDYVDLYLQHKPEMQGSASNLEIWKGLEDVYHQGLAKAIGVSTFSVRQLHDLCQKAEVKPHNVQNQSNLFNPDKDAFEYCKENGIAYTAFSPLGNPGWSGNVGKPNPMLNESVKGIAARHNKTSAQVLMRHLLQRGMAVIPKSVHQQRIAENFAVFDFSLSDAEMAELDAQATRK